MSDDPTKNPQNNTKSSTGAAVPSAKPTVEAAAPINQIPVEHDLARGERFGEKYDGMDGKLTETELHQDQKFMQSLTDNVSSIKDSVSAGARIEEELADRPQITEEQVKELPISEAEARILLDDETRKVNQNLRKTDHKARKVLMIVIVVAIIMVAMGAAFAMIMGYMNKQEQNNNGNSAQGSVSQTDDNTSKNDTVVLDVDNETVQSLYQKFNKTNGTIYTDEYVLSGEIPEWFMLSLAKENTEMVACKQPVTEEILIERYGAEALAESGNEIRQLAGQCYNGSELVARAKELFGRELTLKDGDRIGSFTAGGQPHYRYDADNDEFWYISIPGGGMLYKNLNVLYAAEQDGDKLYLYEVVGKTEYCLKKDGGFAYAFGGVDKVIVESGIANDTGMMASNLCKDEYLVDYIDDNGNLKSSSEMIKNSDKLSRFKWIFTKGADGDYVFEKIEKIEE